MAHRQSNRIAEAIIKSMLPLHSNRIAAAVAARATAIAAKKKVAFIEKHSKKSS